MPGYRREADVVRRSAPGQDIFDDPAAVPQNQTTVATALFRLRCLAGKRLDHDMTGGAQDLELLYTVGRGLADGNSWPQWRDNAEFRAARVADGR